MKCDRNSLLGVGAIGELKVFCWVQKLLIC